MTASDIFADDWVDELQTEYLLAMEKLCRAGFAVMKHTFTGLKKSGEILSLSVFAPPLLMDKVVNEIRELLGEGFNLFPHTNLQEIVIQKIKTNP